jgi:uncharacterized Fe-S cluster-containing radical SAM superfamily protein
MAYAGTNADPDKLGRIPLRRLLGEDGPYSDEPSLPVYRIRRYEGKRLGSVVFFEVLGCDASCAHCYVPEEYLRAKISSERVQEALRRLPGKLKGNLLNTADDIYEYGRARQAKLGDVVGKALELTGGETSLYRGGIKRLAQRAKEDGMIVIVKSNGYLIASHDEYLDAFQGLEDTLKFSFSVRGTTAEEARRFSGVNHPGYYLVPFIAAEKVMAKGFEAPLLDVTLDTLADEGLLRHADNPVTRLDALFRRVGFEGFRNMDANRITQQIFGNRFPGLDRKMVERGYWSKNDDGGFIRHTDPKAVERYFEREFGIRL